jgi:hypothetical protein
MANALDRNELFSFAKSHRQEYEALLKRFVETPYRLLRSFARGRHPRRTRSHRSKPCEATAAKVDVYKVNKGNPLVHCCVW